MIRIRFKTRRDGVAGYYELASSGMVRSLPDNNFEISENGKEILDRAKIQYDIVKSDEVSLNEAEAIRNSLTAGI